MNKFSKRRKNNYYRTEVEESNNIKKLIIADIRDESQKSKREVLHIKNANKEDFDSYENMAEY